MDSLKHVTIRPWPTTRKDEISPEDLMQQIAQLTTERGGHLRDITEKSLQEEIIAGKDVTESTTDEAEKKKVQEDTRSKEQIQQDNLRAGHQMVEHLEWAKFATNNLIDVLSLILSADPNRRSQQSFSQRFYHEVLTKGVPFGSFGLSSENHEQHVRKPEEEQVLQEHEQRQELVAKGARMEALDSVTDEILKAAKKLEREVRRETKYWQEIVSISDKGWPIQRLRQNVRKTPFAVRYGHPEASSHFKARGLAPLRMDKDGSIMLDPALKLKPKTLRVRVSENGEITGASRLSIEGEANDVAIEKTIQLARDSLFEEELYHEMSIESRQLLPYGVEFRDSVIHVKASTINSQHTEKKLLIDCVPREDSLKGCQDHSQDWLAQNVAEGLRLLLTHEHSMRLHRRSQLPPALNPQKRESPPPQLLRILVAVFHHLENVDSLYARLEATAKTLQSAGLDVSLDSTREVSWANLAESLKVSSGRRMSATDQLLEIFLKPFDGKATLTLPPLHGAQPEEIRLATRTTIGHSNFGTEHKLTLPPLMFADLSLFQQMKIPSVEETISYLDLVLSLHIAHRYLKSNFSKRAVVRSNDPRITIKSKALKGASAGDNDISVELKDGVLRVTSVVAYRQGAIETSQQSHTWKGREIGRPLMEVVKNWVE